MRGALQIEKIYNKIELRGVSCFNKSSSPSFEHMAPCTNCAEDHHHYLLPSFFPTTILGDPSVDVEKCQSIVDAYEYVNDNIEMQIGKVEDKFNVY